MGSTPAQADAFIEAVSVMYDWAVERNYIAENTAKGIKQIYRKESGATPWKAADVKKFFATHKYGSKPYIAMNVLLWTGCRIEDLTILGRKFECVIEGMEALRWTPLKRGLTEVCLPLFAPLTAATRSATVQGNTYVLGRGGPCRGSCGDGVHPIRNHGDSRPLRSQDERGLHASGGVLAACAGCYGKGQREGRLVLSGPTRPVFWTGLVENAHQFSGEWCGRERPTGALPNPMRLNHSRTT